jgi:hypothetical protein
MTPTAGSGALQPQVWMSLSLTFQQPHHRIGSRITLTMELRDNFSPVLSCISRGLSTQASILDIPQAVLLHTTGRSPLTLWSLLDNGNS